MFSCKNDSQSEFLLFKVFIISDFIHPYVSFYRLAYHIFSLYFDDLKFHYANTSVQYTAYFKNCKNDSF